MTPCVKRHFIAFLRNKHTQLLFSISSRKCLTDIAFTTPRTITRVKYCVEEWCSRQTKFQSKQLRFPATVNFILRYICFFLILCSTFRGNVTKRLIELGTYTYGKIKETNLIFRCDTKAADSSLDSILTSSADSTLTVFQCILIIHIALLIINEHH